MLNNHFVKFRFSNVQFWKFLNFFFSHCEIFFAFFARFVFRCFGSGSLAPVVLSAQVLSTQHLLQDFLQLVFMYFMNFPRVQYFALAQARQCWFLSLQLTVGECVITVRKYFRKNLSYKLLKLFISFNKKRYKNKSNH